MIVVMISGKVQSPVFQAPCLLPLPALMHTPAQLGQEGFHIQGHACALHTPDIFVVSCVVGKILYMFLDKEINLEGLNVMTDCLSYLHLGQ